MAKGYSQRPGEDYNESFSQETIKLLIAIAASRGWSLRQVNPVTAFQNGNLEDAIYVEQPKVFEEGDAETNECLLAKIGAECLCLVQKTS